MNQNQSLRQRGWSIHSSDHDSRSQQQRPRADSQMTCDTDPMSDTEKLHLLSCAFEEGVGDSVGIGGNAAVSKPKNSKGVNRTTSDLADDEVGGDDLAIGGGEAGEANVNNKMSPKVGKESEPPTKRRKTVEDEAIATGNKIGGDSSGGGSSISEDESEKDEKLNTLKRSHVQLTTKQQEQLDLAKNNLSKWAARLFDPNRRRGLVEAPKVIPLNDEFLSAFGKREKEYDEASGRVIDIDKISLDIIDVSDDDNECDKTPKSKEGKKINFNEMTNRKVKISNLSYKTTSATIASTCEAIGPVLDVNLILDDNGQSSGRAYVVFEDHENAVTCAEKMNEKQLEGRTLYVSLASASGRKTLDPMKKQDSRYWERDISTKCNYCGEVGHITKNCPNEQKLKPCGLCAEVGHEMWSCPQKSVCFNCGVPGHVSRDCNQRRGLPERLVCTICYRSGHHRFDCDVRPWDAPWQDAVCMQCGKLGHLMCSEMRWFFGLKGATCFNCGEKDHMGTRCRRPNVDECQKNPDVALQELNRAGTMSLSDQLSNQRSSRESRGQNSNGNNRPRSMPPPRNRGNNDYSRRGSNSRWQEPPPQRSHHRF